MFVNCFLLFFMVGGVLCGDECLTPNGEKATCIAIRSCPILHNAVLTFESASVEFVKRSQCGFKTEPLVCCGTSAGYQTSTTTTVASIKKNNLIPNRRYCGYQHYDDYFHTENETLSSSSIDEFPWLASIKYHDHNGVDKGFLCAATLITNQHVLTTAHCIHVPKNNITLVRLGEYNIGHDKDCIKNEQFDECSDPVLDLEVGETIIHENYDAEKRENDIAIIKLKTPVVYSDYIRPICLPLPGTKLANFGDILIQSGWGITGLDRKKTNVKKKVRTQLLPNDECRKVFPAKAINITDALTCTKEPPNANVFSCAGDSGAPVMFSYRNQWHQEGMIAYGNSCNRDTPSLNINVAYFLNWIIDNVKP